MKKKSNIIIVLILIILIVLFIFIRTKHQSYSTTYNVNKYKILEEYNEDIELYKFILEKDNIKYAYEFNMDYVDKKNLINNIEVYNNDDICILPKSDKIKFYPLCSNNNDIYTYNLSNQKIKDFKYNKNKKISKEYKGININYYGNLNYLVYNYSNFYYLNKDTQKELKIFNKDNYNIELLYQIDEYILVADYNDDYYFKKFYLINMKKGNVKEIEFDYEISFDSYFIGDYKDDVYLIDKKEKKEYKIDIDDLEVEVVDPVILKDNKLVIVSIKKIIHDKLYFDNYNIKYKIINKKLYEIIDDIKIKISDLEVSYIVKIDKNSVYYISDYSLYMFDYLSGETKLLENFEWNFNKTNMVFIY